MRTYLLLFILSLQLGAQTNSSGSEVAYTISENDLLPESIGYDPMEEAFYMGSTRKGKIVKVAKDGTESTFLASGVYDQWMIIGIKVDSKRNELWFCSSGGGNLIGYSLEDSKEGRPAGVFKVDLKTGKLIKKYTLEKQGEVHFFNDLVIDENGDVYVSHMFNDHVIYKIDRDTDELEPFSTYEAIKYPNGMDISEDGKYLFVAHSDGIARISLATGDAISLSIANDVKLTRRESLDGLYVHNNTLVGIQAGINRLTRYQLSQPMDAIMKEEILQDQHPKMDNPTTGVLIGDTFYYVANAQFQKVEEDGSIDQPLSNPVILKHSLK